MTEKMKPSGIAWIGDVPRSWKCKKLKYLISEPLQYGANEEGCDFEETYPRYIRITDIEDNNQLKSDGKQSLLPSVAVPYILNDGDVLFARSGATVGKTFIYSSEVGCAAFAGYLIRASVDKKQILPKYLYYCTINGGYDNWKNSVFTQATIQNIGADKYAQFSIAFPSITEQQCIANFLDIQCAKIDSVIADIEKQIETLQKYKKSMITEAVTKGLERSVPMKDSGVDWIGKIPLHWRIIRITKYLDSLVDYRGKTPEKVDDGVFLVTARNIKNGIVDYSLSQEYVAAEEYEQIMHRGKPEIGDVLFTTEAPLGEVANVDRTDIALAQRVIKFRGRKGCVDNYYLKYWLMSLGFQSFLWSLATGSTALGIAASKLGQLKMVLPPIDEQKAIAERLDCDCTNIDAIIVEKRKQLETAQQYKKSLIYEYVTGKKRVTEVN